MIARTSISGIRWVEALLHPDRVGHVDQAHEKGTVAFSECVSAGASEALRNPNPDGSRSRRGELDATRGMTVRVR